MINARQTLNTISHPWSLHLGFSQALHWSIPLLQEEADSHKPGDTVALALCPRSDQGDWGRVCVVHGEFIEGAGTGLGGYYPKCSRRIALGKSIQGQCVLCTLELVMRIQGMPWGRCQLRGCSGVGWAARLTHWRALGAECLIHVVHKPRFFPLSFPQSRHSRGIWTGWDGRL